MYLGTVRCFDLCLQLSTLPILASEEISRNEDEECSVRQIVRHVCAALRRYFEAHLFKKVETTSRRVMLDSGPSDTPGQNFLMSNYYKVNTSVRLSLHT